MPTSSLLAAVLTLWIPGASPQAEVELAGADLPFYFQCKALLSVAHDAFESEDPLYEPLVSELGLASGSAALAAFESAIAGFTASAPVHPPPREGEKPSDRRDRELEWLREDVEHVNETYRSVVDVFCEFGLELDAIDRFLEEYVLPGLFGTATPEEWDQWRSVTEPVRRVEECWRDGG